MTVTVIEPANANPRLKDPNDLSVAVRLDYLDKSFLFVGDMEDKAEATWLNKLTPDLRKLADVDVLKVGHHGSDTSSTPAFVAWLVPGSPSSPAAFAMSAPIPRTCTRASPAWRRTAWFATHPPAAIDPTPKQMTAYDAHAEEWVKIARPQGLYLTVLDGNLTVETDGTNIWVNKTK